MAQERVEALSWALAPAANGVARDLRPAESSNTLDWYYLWRQLLIAMTQDNYKGIVNISSALKVDPDITLDEVTTYTKLAAKTIADEDIGNDVGSSSNDEQIS